jgi:hypothetical protein
VKWFKKAVFKRDDPQKFIKYEKKKPANKDVLR